jgi:hypothetical protein
MNQYQALVLAGVSAVCIIVAAMIFRGIDMYQSFEAQAACSQNSK